MNSNGPGRHKWGFPVHTPNIFFQFSVFQASLLLIYFRDGPSRSAHCIKVWGKTYSICDAAFSWLERRSFALSQKSRRHNRSYVWTEALSGMIFVRLKRAVLCEHSLTHCQSHFPGAIIYSKLHKFRWKYKKHVNVFKFFRKQLQVCPSLPPFCFLYTINCRF